MSGSPPRAPGTSVRGAPDLVDDLRAALALIDHLVAERDAAVARSTQLEAQVADLRRRQSTEPPDPTYAELSKGHARRLTEIRAMWQTLGEQAALKGWAPPLLRGVHESPQTYHYASTHAVAVVIGRALEACGLPPLRRAHDGDALVGSCPLCLREGLHVHDKGYQNTWGCRACGRFGDSYHFATLYEQIISNEDAPL